MSITVYLGDLGYYNDYNFNQPTPLNVAYVGRYLKTRVPEARVELFKHPLQLLQRINDAPPTIIGLSHYQWTSNLNLKVIEAAKAANPATISVLGGPHWDATNREWMADFFAARPQIDFHIDREGEATFADLVESLIAVDFDPAKLNIDAWPCTLFAYDRDSGIVLHNSVGAFDRMDLTQLPSPYLDGWMDKFLEDPHLAPILETNRGCPYSCSFCAWGNATQSKVRQFPVEVVVEEIRYVATRSKNPHKLLYLADANFGILKRDEDIARAIADSSVNLGFPKQTYVYFAKNTNERVIRVAELMKTVTSMSMSKQSVNDDVLANIKRSNIPHEQYDDLMRECEKRGIQTFSELIYGLPGETYDSFVKGVIRTVRQKATRVAIYPLLLIAGAENYTAAHREMFGIQSKYRVFPRFISTMEGLRTLEYEEVTIANDALSFEDWLRIREFHFLINLFASEVFSDLKLELEAHDLDYATLATRILEDKPAWPATWTALLERFRRAAVEELLEPEDLRVEYDADEMDEIELKFPAQNYYYYAALACSRKTVTELHNYLGDGLARLFPEATEGALPSVRGALSLCFDRMICYEDFEPRKDVAYSADLDAWTSDAEGNSLAAYRLEQPRAYLLSAEESLRPRLDELLSRGLSLTDAVYKLRNGYIGYRGDVVFAYWRTVLEHAKAIVA
ncbi:MAG: radical SAM protein [Alphaproteobacteria bacterium]|nr:radical SAM protein [Alphaproteobacteria bacterium]